MPICYEAARIISKAVATSYFKEVKIIGLERIPVNGPVIFVGNHNNRFVDATLLMATIPRTLRFLIATVSLQLRVVGNLARLAGAVGVNRPQDMRYPGMGRIIDMVPVANFRFQGVRRSSTRLSADFISQLAVPSSHPHHPAGASKDVPSNTLLSPPTNQSSNNPSPDYREGTVLLGDNSTRFPLDCKRGDKLKIDGVSEHVTVIDILDDKILVVHEAVSWPHEAESTEESENKTGQGFTVYPKVNQGEVYEHISQALYEGECICIFPEGGSHDQPNLLPLKPGVALMGLTAAVMGVEDVLIIPVGIHYFNRHKFGSRAVVEVGQPLAITEHLVRMYTSGEKRQAVDMLMADVKEGLLNCMISAPDYDTLKAIQLCASLYPPERMRLTVERHHQLYSLFSQLFQYFGNDPPTVSLKEAVLQYSEQLEANGLQDDEVHQMKYTAEAASIKLIQRVILLIFILIISLPGLLIMLPPRAVLDFMTERHRLEATSKSSVKIHGEDVIASYKISRLMVVLPCLYLIVGCFIGLSRFPSLWGVLFTIAGSLVVLPVLTYNSLKLQAKLLPLLKQIRCYYRVIISELDVWREREREVIFDRIDLQLRVRGHVKSLLHEGIQRAISTQSFSTELSPVETSSAAGRVDFQDGSSVTGGTEEALALAATTKAKKLRELQTDLERIIPLVLLDADTRRLLRAKDRYIPMVYRSAVVSREEIL